MTVKALKSKTAKRAWEFWQLYLLLIPGLLWLFLFCYYPMYGVLIAFKDYRVNLGILHSPWAGLKYFRQFFSTSIAMTTVKNTFILSLVQLVFTLPAPVLFALMLNQLKGQGIKKVVQTIAFAPHFISTVVLVTIMQIILSPQTGFVNRLLSLFGIAPKMFMTRPEYFRPLYVVSSVWQGMGFNSIIYTAALAGIDIELHEAATIDGASRIQRIRYIDIPGILPTIIIVSILTIGNMMSVGYEKAFLMQSGMNTSVSEIISTYVYKIGLQNAQFSFSTAIGLFNSVVNLVILLVANGIARRFSDTSLF